MTRLLPPIIPLAIVPLAIVLAGCPGPGAAITSIDGLAGGAVTTPISVPSLAIAETTTTADLSATSASIDELSVETSATIEDLTANTLTATTLAADTAELTELSSARATVTALALPPVVAEPPSAVDNGGLLGNLLGATATAGDALTNIGGYAAANAACVDEFAATSITAHVCSDLEVLRFARGSAEAVTVFSQSPAGAGIDGASYATMSIAVVGFNSTDTPILADDCGGWANGLLVAPDAEHIHARHVLRIFSVDGTSSLALPETTNDCSIPSIRFLCCG